jgi:hypothetical protein
MRWRLMTGNSDLIDMAPERAKKGDLSWCYIGCSIPVLLRKTSHEGKFDFVGECYLEGFMSGEAIEDGNLRTKDLRLC